MTKRQSQCNDYVREMSLGHGGENKSQERFNAAVMIWISEATSIYASSCRSDGGRKIMAEACMRCWAEFGYDTTILDAAPAATAVSTDDRTDKAAPSQCRDRPGETPDRPEPIKDCDSDRSYPIGIDPAAYEGDIVSRLRHWRGLHLAHSGELFEAAADEIERLRTIMYRIVDEDCTVAIQNGTFYADDEALFAVPRTPPMQPTPGKGSKPSECA